MLEYHDRQTAVELHFVSLIFYIIVGIKDRSCVCFYLWSCNAERRVGQFEPFLRFLPGQTSCLPQLLKLIRKLKFE